MPVKPLSFKGDKRPKKRKHHDITTPATTDQDGTTVAASDSSTDIWTLPSTPSDLSGPTLLVLPTKPPTCLASDANGTIFASAIENMVENDPRTSEPHDVRQVWVVNRVPGVAEGEVSFRATHGGYLSCDGYGTLGAKREARGMEEGFTLEIENDTDTGRDIWRIRTNATKDPKKVAERRYLCAIVEGDQKISSDEDNDHDNGPPKPKTVSISLRGDGDASSSSTQIVLRMQSEFKPQSQASKEASSRKEKIGRRELEAAAGRSLNDDEIRKLKKAKREGFYHEEILDMRAKGKYDKYA